MTVFYDEKGSLKLVMRCSIEIYLISQLIEISEGKINLLCNMKRVLSLASLITMSP
jgi:hypothetical protein